MSFLTEALEASTTVPSSAYGAGSAYSLMVGAESSGALEVFLKDIQNAPLTDEDRKLAQMLFGAAVLATAGLTGLVGYGIWKSWAVLGWALGVGTGMTLMYDPPAKLKRLFEKGS